MDQTIEFVPGVLTTTATPPPRLAGASGPPLEIATYRLAFASAGKTKGDVGQVEFTFAKTRIRIAKEMHERINDPRGFVSVHLTQGVYPVFPDKILENKDILEAKAIHDAIVDMHNDSPLTDEVRERIEELKGDED